MWWRSGRPAHQHGSRRAELVLRILSASGGLPHQGACRRDDIEFAMSRPKDVEAPHARIAKESAQAVQRADIAGAHAGPDCHGSTPAASATGGLSARCRLSSLGFRNSRIKRLRTGSILGPCVLEPCSQPLAFRRPWLDRRRCCARQVEDFGCAVKVASEWVGVMACQHQCAHIPVWHN